LLRRLYKALSILECLSDISGLGKLHPNYFLLVIEIFAFSTSHLESDKVIKIVAYLFHIEIGCIYLDFKGINPWA